ncbi:nicotinate-nucleotide diphosphorylase (carboxylating) [Actinomadura sp. NBRC 104412]|uniref:carboxylating nicotinate-nucleotide diphosphorylase n=1 Tax=Actinomadura sp. NBRC 104412 TaxID=3032203 RepID=UPI0024A34902|nr:carboxylating nicotinate-nucleotide diphosphorylase [Actinomadura sp. NBRC 104412]GLZ06358.1 nicotinate-nucleotide diphosphorylase (carboxylating) [Actinomadura sp. NBRC 104412]
MRDELKTGLRAAGLDPQAVENLVREALAEDGEADVTSEPIVAPDDTASGDLTARQDGVVAGIPVAAVVFDLLGVGYAAKAADGDRVTAGQVLLSVDGPTRSVLRAERTALNLLTHLSGIATETRLWVDAVAGTKAKIRDTRKTLPGLRALQKYAVRCGGGVNHRMGLHDAALVKDNHVAAAGSVTRAYDAIRAIYPALHVQVECDTLDQVDEAIAAGATSLLLDNMSDEEMAEAVRRVDGRAELEASGGLTLDRARDAAVTGVDYLAVGALTHSARAFDIGLDFS